MTSVVLLLCVLQRHQAVLCCQLSLLASLQGLNGAYSLKLKAGTVAGTTLDMYGVTAAALHAWQHHHSSSCGGK